MSIIGNKKCGWYIPTLGILLFLFLNGAVQLCAGTLKIKELGKISATDYSDIFINGDYAYCTDGVGLDILDVKDPARPKRTGYYESPGTAWGVEVRNNYAFIADGVQGLQVVNVSNQANPVWVGNWNSIGTADDQLTSVFVRGNYTYALSNATGLLVFDTSTPSKPALVGTFKYENPNGNDPESGGINPQGVFVNFQYAYLVDLTLGLLVVDLTDPTSPQLSSWINIHTDIFKVWVSGDYAYLATREKGMQVVDISTPSNPVPVANYYGPENPSPTNVFISGTRAYVSYYNKMDIVDISSPLAPVRTAAYTGCSAKKVFVRGNYAYVVNYFDVDFTVLDISNPYSPFQVGELDNPEEPRAIALKNNYAYVSDRKRLWVIDVADATKPVIAGQYASEDNENDVAMKGNYAFLASIYPADAMPPYGGLKVLNISSPTFPVLVGQCDTPGIPTEIFLSGNYAYIPDGLNGLTVIDISNPSAPVNIGNYKESGSASYEVGRGVFVKGNYAYFAYEDNGLYILDISTPSDPQLIGKYHKVGDRVMAVTVRDNYAYLSSYYKGLVILDVTNPAQPKPVGRFKINSRCNSEVALNGNYAYILSSKNGIYVIDISDPASPSLACNYGDLNTLGLGQDLLISGNKLYAATDSGFYILEVQPATSTETLTVKSIPDPGAAISVTPLDINQKGNGATSFTRSYNTGTVVTLTAPAEHNGKNFSKWMADGVVNTNRNLEITMNSSHTAKAYYEAAELPVITLNRTLFNFGQMVFGPPSGSQTLLISNSGGGALQWSAAPSSSWIQVNPSSGTGDGEVLVSVNAADLSQGTYTGTITLSDPAAANSPQTVKVTLKVFQDTTPPFGSIDTPGDGNVLQGSIPVTGWALDDIGIDSIKIYRDENNSFVYIGEALLVEGARPDIETAYPDYPNSYKAGWGYMLLTHSLPNGGNGTYTLFAKATDLEGNEVTLGSKTITVDNAHAVKPFGAIDTPSQGGTASGKKFVNNGWALTPQPNTIPVDGSTINVIIDGLVKGHPVYNVFRSDVAALFPGYANTDGAGGYYYFDTTKFKNGVHTIAWIVTDTEGNSDGIGSRYFTIENLDGGTGINSRRGAPPCAPAFNPCSPVFDPCAPIFDPSSPNLDGIMTIESKELERVEINLSSEGEAIGIEGYLVVGNQLRDLPIGSTFDKGSGTFYWQPGPGFIGEYRLVFIEKEETGKINRKNIIVNITPRY